MKKLSRYIIPHLPLILLCVVIKFLGTVAELFIPKLLAQIIDGTASQAQAFRLGGLMLLFALLALAGNVIANCLSTKNACDITERIRYDLFAKIGSLSARDGDRIGTSSLVSRLTSDTYNFCEMLARLQRIGIRAPILMIGGIIMSFTLDIEMTLVMVVLVPVVFAVSFIVTVKGIPMYEKQQHTLDSMVRVVGENCSGVRVIKALSRTDHERERFYSTSDELASSEVRAGSTMSVAKPLNSLILNLGLCAVILVGAVGVDRGETGTGVILAFLTYFTIILNAMITVTRVFIQFSRASASGGRIAEVLDITDVMSIIDRKGRAEEAYLAFDSVSFSYDGVEDNLHDISFSLNRGETLGIIGATGSGKSTLVSLLMRYYDPDCGTVRIGGRDIRSIPAEELRGLFGVAFQNDFIMTGTAGENVDFFRGIDQEDIRLAMQTAQCSGFTDPEDDREISRGGTNISGGQRQRLLIARALAGTPDILILDDSSSALDYATDLQLRRALSDSYPELTSVIIAQRISSVKNADLIIMLDDGEIIGMGTHEHLYSTCEPYRSIADIQMGGQSDG